jgi:uncharacterized protein
METKVINHMVNIQKIFDECMAGKTEGSITASTIYQYVRSPFMLYCDYFAPEDKKDPITEFMKLLFEQGRNHEDEYVTETYPDMVPIKFVDPREGFLKMLEAMRAGVRAMHGMPIFYLNEGLYGKVDILEKHDAARSIFGNYHYVVKEVKLAKNIRDYHRLQAAFYNYVVGKIQGYTPRAYFVINRDREELEFEYDEQELLTVLQDIRDIIYGKKVVAPTYGCADWPWQTHCNEEAIRIRDISLVGGVGSSYKEKLVAAGFKTVEDLAGASLDRLTRVKGIGTKTANKFNTNARALAVGKHIRIGDVSFPTRKTEIFLDLEGTGQQLGEGDLIAIDYLIGVLVREGGKEKYIPFLAKGLDKEGQMFSEFLAWLRKQKDYIIYHWHRYEKTHLEKLCERHGVGGGIRSRLLDNLRDLHKDATSAFAFPTYGYGLKEVANYMGFQWRHEDVDAMESIVFYLRYLDDPKENRGRLQKVIEYNEDDCRATMVVKDWLKEKSREVC